MVGNANRGGNNRGIDGAGNGRAGRRRNRRRFLSAIGYWKVLVKGGHPGWHSLIPILNAYDQYDMAWNGWMGVAFSLLAGFGTALAQNAQGGGVMSVIASICAIAALVINIIGMNKFAKAFGKGVGFTVGLVLLEPFFMMILGFGSSEYIGKPQE